MISLYRNYLASNRLPSCRFLPSCSQYAQEALIRYGCIGGLFRTARRLLCCHPLGGTGYDPVEKQ